jgi:RNA 2',3'-cyclic 3'-phosphodiesterase
MKRIFIAVKVDAGETLLKMVSAFKSRLSSENIKWVRTDNIHITLAFLGNTEDEQIENISKMLKTICDGFGEFELTIRGSGVFKSLNDPRVIWTGIEPSEKFKQLNGLINNGLKEKGIKMEERPFRPHLTLGRIKYMKSGNALRDLIETFREAEIQKVPVNEVILYESVLLASGPLYNPIGIFKI